MGQELGNHFLSEYRAEELSCQEEYRNGCIERPECLSAQAGIKGYGGAGPEAQKRIEVTDKAEVPGGGCRDTCDKKLSSCKFEKFGPRGAFIRSDQACGDEDDPHFVFFDGV